MNAVKKNNPDNEAHQQKPNETSEFKAMLNEWSHASKKLLKTLEMENSAILNELEPKQNMALGALQAHLHMAMKAKSVIEN